MFQFTGFPSIRYGLAYGWQESVLPGFPIQKSPDQWIFAPPRSFSQLITSFFGSQCQGIHPTLFFLDHSGFRQLTKTIALVFGLVIFFVFVRCIMLCFRFALHLGCLVIVLTFISSMCSFQGPFELFVLFDCLISHYICQALTYLISD